ncbi:hypothetical protein [Rhodoferax sp. GW822-FHT02A01]|uniref:hypothetical protein n=1 Tax=Rhodoferax sp. GW822-FHT02A01 TaxID=3141537 RepID=UPI00315C4F1A
MNKLTYNGALLMGTALISVGAGMQFGVAVGLIAAGGLLIALTFAGVYLSGKGVA